MSLLILRVTSSDWTRERGHPGQVTSPTVMFLDSGQKLVDPESTHASSLHADLHAESCQAKHCTTMQPVWVVQWVRNNQLLQSYCDFNYSVCLSVKVLHNAV
ncbi:hypothetical protein GOODEAATRI_018434 [Goodea atripinnis]|uniref:Uncharacterized protein n=1 Tax=Goodea atripinnis TaxID=208336 RepID=A0ABV0PF33_9TELE